ncbi:hypothetical protein [Candidatus Sulfurimonas baltica]|uniref:DUF4375 domain-containing protein n=1 Tax=Candidatus Sulfurimonas baltica TaxID=2740404 RepID=A0A7S7LX17_9BACT|nr:hypothetical protein [Candidatus Sulfurimonas baltica]QOY53033.1 hypothetical protein HUE88_04950 [Candidatus Sulfurimonas baltica]
MKASQKLKDEVIKRASEIKEDGYHQAILNIMYEEWQQREATSYKEILEWYKQEFGNIAKFAVLIGKMNQQVTNGGFIQYYHNGYCDGKSGYANEHDIDLPLHQELVMLFSQSELSDEASLEVFKILQEFHIDIDTDETVEEDGYDENEEYYIDIVDNENYGAVVNSEYLSKLDNAYYEICDEFMEVLEQYFKKKIEDEEMTTITSVWDSQDDYAFSIMK